jgi:hypothetical protein
VGTNNSFLTHAKANWVPLSSLALLKCEVTGENGVFPDVTFRERFHYDKECENWILNQFTDLPLLAQIHGYLSVMISIKTLIECPQKFKFTCNNFYNSI